MRRVSAAMEAMVKQRAMKRGRSVPCSFDDQTVETRPASAEKARIDFVDVDPRACGRERPPPCSPRVRPPSVREDDRPLRTGALGDAGLVFELRRNDAVAADRASPVLLVINQIRRILPAAAVAFAPGAVDADPHAVSHTRGRWSRPRRVALFHTSSVPGTSA